MPKKLFIPYLGWQILLYCFAIILSAGITYFFISTGDYGAPFSKKIGGIILVFPFSLMFFLALMQYFKLERFKQKTHILSYFYFLKEKLIIASIGVISFPTTYFLMMRYGQKELYLSWFKPLDFATWTAKTYIEAFMCVAFLLAGLAFLEFFTQEAFWQDKKRS